MIFPVVATPAAAHGHKKGKVTCVTCKLKKCVGRCRFEKVACPPPRAS